MFTTITLAANQRVEFVEPFDFIRVMDTTATVSLEFYRAGREIDEANGVTAGYSESWAEPCDKLAITNGTTAQTISVATRLGSRVEYDKPPTGNVSIVGTAQVIATMDGAAVTTQTQPTVGTASAQLLAANGSRKAMILQNKSQTATVYLNLAGAAATVAAGLRVRPGETFTWDQRVTKAQVNAIADAATSDLCLLEMT